MLNAFPRASWLDPKLAPSGNAKDTLAAFLIARNVLGTNNNNSHWDNMILISAGVKDNIPLKDEETRRRGGEKTRR